MSSATATKSVVGKLPGSIAELLLHIHEEIDIDAPVATVFQSVLEQLGPAFSTPDGTSLGLKIEAWPGGRWYRDLGNNTGHLWGHVQVIKPPKLIELCGPMAMSYAAINHVQYRLTEQGRGTHLSLLHRGFGEISTEHREGMTKGWGQIMIRIKNHAQR